MAFDLPIMMRNALVLQAKTRSALSISLIAEANEIEQKLANALLVWSTFVASITIPLWLVILQ